MKVDLPPSSPNAKTYNGRAGKAIDFVVAATATSKQHKQKHDRVVVLLDGVEAPVSFRLACVQTIGKSGGGGEEGGGEGAGGAAAADAQYPFQQPYQTARGAEHPHAPSIKASRLVSFSMIVGLFAAAAFCATCPQSLHVPTLHDEWVLSIKRDWLGMSLSEADIAAADEAAAREAMAAPRIGRNGVDRSAPESRAGSGAGRRDDLRRRPGRPGPPNVKPATGQRDFHRAPFRFSDSGIFGEHAADGGLFGSSAPAAGNGIFGDATQNPFRFPFKFGQEKDSGKDAARLRHAPRRNGAAVGTEYSGKAHRDGVMFFQRSGRRATEEEMQQQAADRVVKQGRKQRQEDSRGSTDTTYSSKVFRAQR